MNMYFFIDEIISQKSFFDFLPTFEYKYIVFIKNLSYIDDEEYTCKQVQVYTIILYYVEQSIFFRLY